MITHWHGSDRLRRWFYWRSARNAELLIADPEFSRKEIEAAYGIEPDRIRVVPRSMRIDRRFAMRAS